MSCMQNKEGVDKTLEEYWSMNVLGAWVAVREAAGMKDAPCPHDVCAMGAILKPTGAVRIIVDASKPIRYSLNDYIEVPHVHMATVWSAVQHVEQDGWMWQVDLSNAFMNLPVSPHS